MKLFQFRDFKDAIASEWTLTLITWRGLSLFEVAGQEVFVQDFYFVKWIPTLTLSFGNFSLLGLGISFGGFSARFELLPYSPHMRDSQNTDSIVHLS